MGPFAIAKETLIGKWTSRPRQVGRSRPIVNGTTKIQKSKVNEVGAHRPHVTLYIYINIIWDWFRI